MNKTKTWREQPTKEAAFYMREVSRVCADVASKSQIEAKFMDAWVRERVGIKRAITGGGVPLSLSMILKLYGRNAWSSSDE